jgi:hypothetical protein
MGFLSFLGKVGSFLKSGIGKVAGLVGKIAPTVSSIAGMIPHPLAQGIASAANMAGTIVNGVSGAGTDSLTGQVVGGLNAAGLGNAANTVQQVSNGVQQIGGAVQGAFGGGGGGTTSMGMPQQGAPII